jgi:hypothetical protein
MLPSSSVPCINVEMAGEVLDPSIKLPRHRETAFGWFIRVSWIGPCRVCREGGVEMEQMDQSIGTAAQTDRYPHLRAYLPIIVQTLHAAAYADTAERVHSS